MGCGSVNEEDICELVRCDTSDFDLLITLKRGIG